MDPPTPDTKLQRGDGDERKPPLASPEPINTPTFDLPMDDSMDFESFGRDQQVPNGRPKTLISPPRSDSDEDSSSDYHSAKSSFTAGSGLLPDVPDLCKDSGASKGCNEVTLCLL
ncbi:hypothetical protein AAVH_18551 [Aphelenchoides avenae]|nr:hypothetical protein AAVH_18551 [Aphelenchus avenae]